MEQPVRTSYSEDIKDIIGALSKAQGVMKPAVFNKQNPHFKSKYADFSSCMDACRGPLSENGLAIIQYCETIDGKLHLITMLAHTSGQWLKSEFPLITMKMDSQGLGSAMTYAKRYTLCGLIGVVADEDVINDDDGEKSVGRGNKKNEAKKEESVSEIKFISAQQVLSLKTLEVKLDQDLKDKLNKWLKEKNCESIDSIPEECFETVLTKYQNAVRYLEQQKKDSENA